jgi:glycosyltransferase involved in cell wall biosynthesis
LRPLRVLTFSTLYPSASRPRHGIFVETRLRQLLALGGVEARVLAPVPWFPLQSPVFGRYAAMASTPAIESRHGVEVEHPRYLVVPKVGMLLQPRLLAATALRAARRSIASGHDFDVIDAHYFYPDGVAARLLAGALRKPFVITARGSDLNVIAERALPRAAIVAAANAAYRVICVSDALRRRALALGIAPDRLEVLRNGVDTALFAPRDRAAARSALGIAPRREGPLLLAVGNLVPEKGLDLALRVLARLPGATLVLVGDGGERARLEHDADALGVRDGLVILAPMPQERLALAYSAADALVLPSLREGWPNVLLESMACGTPVVASRVGGLTATVHDGHNGYLIPWRGPEAFAERLRAIVEDRDLRERMGTRARRTAERFGWTRVACDLDALYTRLWEGRATMSCHVVGEPVVAAHAHALCENRMC